MPAKPADSLRWAVTVTFLIWTNQATTDGVTGRTSYVAAVYEHAVKLPSVRDRAVSRSLAMKTMYENLAVYENQAKLAKARHADILVFPEDGVYGMKFNREAIYPYLEAIPDPETVTWSPCADPTRFPESEVQHALSCMALRNAMYVVANIGDKVSCDKRKDPKCPDDGRYQYNTAVAYDPKGTLVAKYHKRNLFFEHQFDTPVAEAKFFDTPFGRFGMAICFDLLFYDPAVTLVTHHNVTNLLFPTAWMDALPLFSAIGYHSSFARGLGVNLLGANIHVPLLRFHGSGVYTPDGMASFYYDGSLLSPAKLLVSVIPILKAPGILASGSIRPWLRGSNPLRYTPILSSDDEFQAEVFHDLFTFRPLRESSGEIRVCDKGVCCYLKYELERSQSNAGDLLAFGAFDGLHTYEGQYYLQVCTLLKCADRLNKSSCGSKTFSSSIKLKSLSVRGEFQTPYIFPQVVLTKGSQLELAKADQWNFNSSVGEQKTVSQIISSSGFPDPLLSATLFGRYYDKDNGHDKPSHRIENGQMHGEGNLATDPNGGSKALNSNPLFFSLSVPLALYMLTLDIIIRLM